MLSFATEFPVSCNASSADFLTRAFQWILESPHTSLTPEQLALDQGLTDRDIRSGDERIRLRVAHSELDELVGLEHSNVDKGISWTTSAVFSKSTLSSWVGVRTSREAEHPTIKLPLARKPVLVRTILSGLHGGTDGPLLVQPRPIRLSESDVDLASKLILDTAGTRLPVVYLSSPFSGGVSIDVNGLANDLAGMAHVLVEPSRDFSRRLQVAVESENVYGGAIGVYWPESSGRRSSFFPWDFPSLALLKRALVEEIRMALLNRRPLYRCSWAAIDEASSRALYKEIKESGSEEVQRYAEAFDQDMAAKDAKLADAEGEISRLRSEIRAFEARSGRARGLLKAGGEQDFFPGEIEDVLLETLDQARSGLQQGSRRLHIVDEVLRANVLSREFHTRRERLKSALRETRSLDKKARDILHELGFSIEEGGKHYKLIYRGDDRYTFILARTGSDYRGGLNAASDIGKRVF